MSGSSYTVKNLRVTFTLTNSNAKATIGGVDVPIYTTNTETLASVAEETDDSLRYRISLANNASVSGVEQSIRLFTLSVSDVIDCIITPMARGAGTIDVQISTSQPIPNPQTLQRVQQILEQLVVPAGIPVRVLGVQAVSIDLTVRVAFSTNTPSTTQDQVRSNIRTALYFFTSNIGMGSSLLMSDIRSVINAQSSAISDLAILGMNVNGQTMVPDDVYTSQSERIVPGEIVVL